MSKIIKITAFFLFFVMCFCVKNALAQTTYTSSVTCNRFCLEGTCVASGNSFVCQKDGPETDTPIAGFIGCRFGQTCCKVNGVDTCYDEGEAPTRCLSCGEVFVDPDLGESCGTSGTTQSKYTASGCTYLTSTRTCCDSGSWSSWGGSCPKTCSNSSRPMDVQTCVASNGKTGTQTRSVTCNTSTGEWITGTWGTCNAPDCTSGQTRTCPSNSNKIQTCLSTGKWSSSCSCENVGNGKVYCQGMPITVAEASTCLHGIWSDTTCTGICCCSGDTPKLMSNGTPGCWGTQRTPGMENGFGGLDGGMQTWKGSCVCQIKSQMSDRLPNLM